MMSIVGVGWERVKARQFNGLLLGFCNHAGYDGHSLRTFHLEAVNSKSSDLEDDCGNLWRELS